MTIIITNHLYLTILYCIIINCFISNVQNAQIYPFQTPSSQITYTSYPDKNYGNGVGNTFNGYGNLFNGNQNSINGNVNNLNGNYNQVNGNANQVTGNNNLIAGSGNIVVGGTGGTSDLSGFSNKNIAASFSGLSSPPAISIPLNMQQINIPTTNSNLGNIPISKNNTTYSGQNLLNNMNSNTMGFSLPNRPNINSNIINNQQPILQQYYPSQPPVIDQNLGYSNSYNQIISPSLPSNFAPTYPNQQISSFIFTQPQLQVPSFSYPTNSNQGYQMIPSQYNSGSSYTIPSTNSYPFLGTGSNFGSIQNPTPYNSYNVYQAPSTSQNYNPYLNNAGITYSPYNYYTPPVSISNPYVANNPTLSNVYNQFPGIYQHQQTQTTSYPSINSQAYSNNINLGSGAYTNNINTQANSPNVGSSSTPNSGYYNSQFSQSNNLASNNQNAISGMQILQNLMLKLNSNGMITNP